MAQLTASIKFDGLHQGVCPRLQARPLPFVSRDLCCVCWRAGGFWEGNRAHELGVSVKESVENMLHSSQMMLQNPQGEKLPSHDARVCGIVAIAKYPKAYCYPASECQLPDGE